MNLFVCIFLIVLSMMINFAIVFTLIRSKKERHWLFIDFFKFGILIGGILGVLISSGYYFMMLLDIAYVFSLIGLFMLPIQAISVYIWWRIHPEAPHEDVVAIIIGSISGTILGWLIVPLIVYLVLESTTAAILSAIISGIVAPLFLTPLIQKSEQANELFKYLLVVLAINSTLLNWLFRALTLIPVEYYTNLSIFDVAIYGVVSFVVGFTAKKVLKGVVA